MSTAPTIAEITSSPGAAARASASSRSRSCAAAYRVHSSVRAGSGIAWRTLAMTMKWSTRHPRNSSSSSGGRSSIAMSVRVVSSTQYAPMSSQPPEPASPSTSSCANASIRGSSAVTRGRVNPRWPTLRTGVCSGGSIAMKAPRMSSGETTPANAPGTGICPPLTVLVNVATSVMQRSTSSRRVTTHTPSGA